MSDASTPKRKPTAKIFHVSSFVVLFSYIFLLMWKFKISIECFSSNQFDEIKHALFFKNWIQQNCFKFCCLYILSNLFDSTPEIQCYILYFSQSFCPFCIILYYFHHSWFALLAFIFTCC